MAVERAVIVGLGSNVGSRESLVRAAVDALGAHAAAELVGRSPLYETAPVGPAQPRYLNAAVLLRTSLAPEALLSVLLDVERLLGRARRERWGPRTIDLDLLWIEGEVVDTPTLAVPHAELARRVFALRPLLALRPDAVDPRDGVALRLALAALPPDETLRERPFEDAFDTVSVDHTADEGFVVRAPDRADLLAAAAEAMGALIVNPASVTIARAVEASIAVDADAGDDERLFAWLSEALYHLDAGRLALRRAVILDDGPTSVRGLLLGDDLDETRQDVRSALKAVTWHALEAGPGDDGGWRAQVVIDV